MSLDPRYRMAKETAFADHDVQGGRHAVVLQLAEGAALARDQALQAVLRALSNHGGIDPAFFDAPADLRVATGWATTEGLLRLEALVQAGQVLKRFEYAQNLLPPRLRPPTPLKPPSPAAVEAPEPWASKGKSDRKPVRNLYAVIDHGCPFMHPLLTRQTDGGMSTRVRALWDQQPHPAGAVHAPPGFSYGTLLSRGQLDVAIRCSGGDEARAYQHLGYEAMLQAHSHGAHALGMLLDDRRRLRQPGPGRLQGEVLFVQLPQGLMGAPSRAVLSRCLIDALVWIEAQRQPHERVVLSLGGGSSQGPHDGSSMVEQALKAFTGWGPAIPGLAQAAAQSHTHRIYIAAGNGREERLHAKPHPKPGKPRTLTWRLPPASEVPASVEFWLPVQAHDVGAQIGIELWSPHGVCVGRLMPGNSVHWPDPVRPLVSMVSSDWAGHGCTLSLIRIAPTAATARLGAAPCGDWRIRIHTTHEISGPVHAYIGRIKKALGFPLRTSQSRFLKGLGSQDVGPREDGTLQGLATADGVIRAGGHVGVGRHPKDARYSAQGPSRDGRVKTPDLNVRVDDGAVLRGRRSIGNRAGVTFRMDGTSVAAPLAARLDPDTRALDPQQAGGPPPRRKGPTKPGSGSSTQSKRPPARPVTRKLKDGYDS